MNYTNLVQNKMLTGGTLFDLGFLKKKKNSGAWFLRTRISNFYQIRCSFKSIDSDGFSIESYRKKKAKIYGGVQRFNGSKLYL